MIKTLEMTVPTGWTLVEPGELPDLGETLARELGVSLGTHTGVDPQRSAAQALVSGLAAPSEGGAELVALLVPSDGLGAELPVTVAAFRLPLATESSVEANRILAGIAAQDDTARLLATDAGPAMRTHALADIDPSHAASLGLADAPVVPIAALRARYLLPPLGEGRWLVLVHTVLGASEESAPTWLELCDALVVGVRWRRDE